MKTICHGMISIATAFRGLKRGLIPMITPGAKSGQYQIGQLETLWKRALFVRYHIDFFIYSTHMCEKIEIMFLSL